MREKTFLVNAYKSFKKHRCVIESIIRINSSLFFFIHSTESTCVGIAKRFVNLIWYHKYSLVLKHGNLVLLNVFHVDGFDFIQHIRMR